MQGRNRDADAREQHADTAGRESRTNRESGIDMYPLPKRKADNASQHFPLEAAVWHREFSLMLCDDREGKGRGASKGGDVGIVWLIHCCTAETDITLFLSNYAPIKIN